MFSCVIWSITAKYGINWKRRARVITIFVFWQLSKREFCQFFCPKFLAELFLPNEVMFFLNTLPESTLSEKLDIPYQYLGENNRKLGFYIKIWEKFTKSMYFLWSHKTERLRAILIILLRNTLKSSYFKCKVSLQ